MKMVNHFIHFIKKQFWGKKCKKSAPKWHPKVVMLSCGTSCVFFLAPCVAFPPLLGRFCRLLGHHLASKIGPRGSPDPPLPPGGAIVVPTWPKILQISTNSPKTEKMSTQRPQKKEGRAAVFPPGGVNKYVMNKSIFRV